MSKKNLNKKLNHLFRDLKIKKNDNILVHSNIAGLSQFYDKDIRKACDLFITCLKKNIGKKGAIIIPTYNYKFTKKKHFDIKRSLSEVGLLGNFFLKKNWKKRTLDPIFSHLVFGKINNFNKDTINTNAFGKKSIFSHLYRENFKILCFCCSSDRITYIHYLEYIFKVPYRFEKKFTGDFIQNKRRIKITYIYNVGKKNHIYRLKETKINQLINKKDFLSSNFGKFQCFSVSSNYLHSQLKKKLRSKKNFLISK